MPLLYECALQPFFLGHIENLPLLGFLAELLEEFGWEQTEELVCNLAAKIPGRERGAPEELRLAAIKMFEPVNALIHELSSAPPGDSDAAYDEEALAKGLVSGDHRRRSMQSPMHSGLIGHRPDRTTIVLLAADGWPGLR